VGELERTEIRLGGLGGQGVVMAGAILGGAASRGGLQAACSSTYGSQARGGVTKADIVVTGGGFIDFPHVTSADILVAMCQEAYEAYLPALAESGLVIFDGYYVKPGDDGHDHLEVEATRMALDTFGKPQPANIIMIGAVVGLTSMMEPERVSDVLHDTFSPFFHDTNDRALQLGIDRGFVLAKERG
jgi:2-oxoglutarate ferredoxin oxidoreductase subunit gamma